MGTLVTNANNNNSTAFGNQRKIERASNGVLWALTTFNQAQAGYILNYSTDGGVTWTSAGSIPNPSGSSGNYVPNASIKMDEDDYLSVALKDPGNGYIYYVRGTPNAARTAYTWSAATQVSPGTSTVFDYPDIVVCRDPATPGAWVGLIVMSITGNSNDKVRSARIAITSGGGVSITEGNFTLSAPLGASNTNLAYASVDFNHTGDGKTVAGGTPHWYVGWSAGATGSGYGIRFRKATYASGSWTWGTEREIDNTLFLPSSATWLNCIFDGARVVLTGWLFKGADSTYSTIVHDRDAADMTTTPRVLANGNSTNPGALARGSATYDSLGNVYLLGDNNAVVYSQRWVRSTGQPDARAVVDSTNISSAFASTRRGPQGQAIDYIWTDGTASPYSVMSGRIVLNQNPTAPTQLTPADNTTWDSSTDQTVTLGYADPDGNPASKVRVYYRPKGTSAPFAVIEQNTTAASGTNVNTTIPAGTWPGEIQWYGQAADSSGAWSDPSPTRTVTGIPAGLAAATGGGGGTAFSAWTISNATENARAVRIAGRTALATIASVSPLTITVEGSTLSATRSAGYTPAQGDTVQADYVSGGWIVQDKIVQ